MSQKHIALFHYTIHNGLPQLSAWETTPSPLTQPYALGRDHQLECTEQFGMQLLTYYGSRALDLYPVGLMTTFSSASEGSFFPNTTNKEKYGIQISCQEVSTGMVEESGLEVEHSKTEHLRSGTKIAFFLVETFPTFQLDLQKMRYTPTISTTSTPYLKNLASPGRLQKTSLSLVLQHILALTGTLKQAKSRWETIKKTDTCERWKAGLPNQRIRSRKRKNFMANCYMHAWSSPWDEPTSQSSKKCLGSFITVLSYHAPAQKDFEQICAGGSTDFSNQPSLDQSLTLFPSTKPTLFQMRVPSLESQLPLEPNGEPGVLYPDGRHLKGSETLAGPKPLASSAWSDISWLTKHRDRTLQYMETTKELSKVGGTEGAAIELSTMSSNGYMDTYKRVPPNHHSTQFISEARPIQQTHPPEGYIPQHPFSFNRYHSHQNSTGSLSTHNYPLQQPNTVPTERDTTPKQQRSSSTILTKGMVLARNDAMTIDAANRPVPSLDMPLPTSKFDQSLPIAEEARFAPPRPYRAGLIPLPSTLRPHCRAWDRLRLW